MVTRCKFSCDLCRNRVARQIAGGLQLVYALSKLSHNIFGLALGGGGVVTCICLDMGMCHYFGYFFGVLPDFGVSFWIVPGFLGIIFLVKLFVQESARFLGTDLNI